MKITIPELSLVVLIGASGSGKSTFARKHFKPTEVLSSDFFRGLVSDDENNQAATKDAFESLHFIAAKRLAAGRLTVVDATNVQTEARKPLLALARAHHVLPVAIVLNVAENVCAARNRERPDRDFGPHVVHQQRQQLRRSLHGLQREGFRHVFVLSSPEEIEVATIERQPLWNNLKHEHGPFDIIGDVHGCGDELRELLEKIGYRVQGLGSGENTGSSQASSPQASDLIPYTPHPEPYFSHPAGRKAIFVGDLVDRGPKVPDVLRLVMGMVEAGTAFCVPGNHDMKLLRKLRDGKGKETHGMAQSLEQLAAEPPEFKQRVVRFLDDLKSHYALDDGNLVVAHAGMRAEYQGRTSGVVRAFALYGETTGETDKFGLPVRYNWAAEYRGRATVVYGHTPVPEPVWLNGTINIDTGCVFGGRLTALRYPERELVAVPAREVYAEPARPFLLPDGSAPGTASEDDVLDIDDVVGKRIIETRLHHTVTIREENAIAALEVMSRFAADPRWLIYLPPTMSPSETTRQPGLLEHPAEAFAYYAGQQVARVICQEKHMGSRAVLIVCRDEDAARKRFGVNDASGTGICYTRTGRRFFTDVSLEAALLAHVRAALDASGLWEELDTDWVCLDCELMPWSAKAGELLRGQYAAVGAAARTALPEAVGALDRAAGQIEEVGALRDRYQDRLTMATRYISAYQRYCWPFRSLADLRVAPFHLLATEGAVHVDKNHLWHMETLAQLCRADDPILHATNHKVVDVNDGASLDEGISWWQELTGRGGEGMVVKPLDFIAHGKIERGERGTQERLVQPAVKCRGRDYLRIIYGPEYTAPGNLERLRARGLGAKRSIALREFALGIEALERFVRREPLRRVHECVFGILALESETVDPRL